MTSPMQESIEELKELLQNLGAWKDRIVFAGGTAALIYAASDTFPELSSGPARTEDIDVILSRRERAHDDGELADVLRQSGYVPEVKSVTVDGEPSQKWVKEGINHYIEFLTHDHQKKCYEIAGVSAQGLTYMRMSYENSVNFELGGVHAKVASPAAFIAHKGLTFPKRVHQGKKFKDVYYIVYVSGLYPDLDSLSTEIMNLKGFLPG